MIIGTGIDIVEISRVKKTYEKQPRFADRILTDRELKDFHGLSGHRQAEFLAGRFAAKEAYSKALGTGIGKDLSFRDIEIAKDENGKPIVSRPENEYVAHVSISHSKDFAVAQVILESLSC